MSEFTTTFSIRPSSGADLKTEDVLAAVLPLMREVAIIHETGEVAPLRGLSTITVHEECALGLNTAEGLPKELLK